MSETAPYEPFPSFEDFANSAGFDSGTFDPFAVDFAVLKSEIGPEALHRSIDTATRWAAVNTGAIENLYEADRGFTYSVAASAAAIENIHNERGQDVQNHIKDAMAGYEFVLDVATGLREVSEHWIKELHSVICASQDSHLIMIETGMRDQPLLKGTYKTLPNNPMNLASGTIHQYAAPEDTGPEMARLVEELRGEAFADATPVLQAAYAHYAFVCIHPFADGNGRVSRALASTYLYRSPGIPLVIFADQKGIYLDTLEAADKGEPGRFVGFVRDCALDAMAMVSQEMRRPEVPSPADRAAQLRAALIAPQGLPHVEMDNLTTRIASAWQDALNAQIANSDLGPTYAINVRTHPNVPRKLKEYRAQTAKTLVLHGDSHPPADSQRQDEYLVLIPRAGTSTVDFQLLRPTGEVLADIALREVHPTVTTAFKYRLQVLSKAEYDRHVDLLTEAALQVLKKKGITE